MSTRFAAVAIGVVAGAATDGDGLTADEPLGANDSGIATPGIMLVVFNATVVALLARVPGGDGAPVPAPVREREAVPA